MNHDRAYYIDTYVAGRLYGDADIAWPNLRVGQAVSLVREPSNEKDPSAVAIYATNGDSRLKLGYMPFRKNQPLSLLLDMGWASAFQATISRLDPAATYDRQIGITIRIIRNRNNEEE